jgi:hypothetical protein
MASASEIQKEKIKNGEITSFFDCLADILLKYSGGELVKSELFSKYFSSYMLCRYLSMRTTLLPYAEFLNFYQTSLTPEQLYKLAYSFVPKQKSGYIKYIKKLKKENEEAAENNINRCNNNMKLALFDI